MVGLSFCIFQFALVGCVSCLPVFGSGGRATTRGETTSIEDDFAREWVCFENLTTADGERMRTSLFAAFIKTQLQEICRTEVGQNLLKNIGLLLQNLSGNEDVKRCLGDRQIKVQFGESGSSFAEFIPGLTEVEDYDEQGYPKLDVEGAIEKALTLKINLRCRRVPEADCAFFVKGGKTQCLYKSTYLGKMKEVEIGNAERRQRVSVSEIGTVYLPVYIVIAHELIHLKHYLATVKAKVYDEALAEVPYGNARKQMGYKDLVNIYGIKNDQGDPDELNSCRLKFVEEYPEFEEQVELEGIAKLLRAMMNLDDQGARTESAVNERIKGFIKNNSFMTTLDTEQEVTNVRTRVDEWLSGGERSDIKRVLRKFVRLARASDWPSIEERRTVMEENTLRVQAKLPIRPLYEDLNHGVLYDFSTDTRKRFGVSSNFGQESYVTGVCEEMSEDLQYMPLPLRLHFCGDRLMKQRFGVDDATVALARAWFGILSQGETLIETPGSDEQGDQTNMLRVTPTNTSGSESDLEDQSKGGILGQIDKMSLGQLKMLKQRIEGKILIQENSSGND